MIEMYKKTENTSNYILTMIKANKPPKKKDLQIESMCMIIPRQAAA